MGQPIPPLPLVPNHNYSIKDWKIRMAMWEINKHADSLSEWLFWKYGKGPTVTVKWPVGPVRVPNGDNAGVLTESADPNDHYRPWLEKNVGKQNRDWIWGMRDNNAAENRLTIKFSRAKAKWAIMAALLWT